MESLWYLQAILFLFCSDDHYMSCILQVVNCYRMERVWLPGSWKCVGIGMPIILAAENEYKEKCVCLTMEDHASIWIICSREQWPCVTLSNCHNGALHSYTACKWISQTSYGCGPKTGGPIQIIGFAICLLNPKMQSIFYIINAQKPSLQYI